MLNTAPEEGALAGFERINAAQVKDRIREIKRDPHSADPDELATLTQWLTLSEQQTAHKRTLRELETALDQNAHQQYAKLTVPDIKTITISDKWMATLSKAVQNELERVSQTLTSRIRELAQRYDTPLPALEQELQTLSARVGEHLQNMGVVWH